MHTYTEVFYAVGHAHTSGLAVFDSGDPRVDKVADVFWGLCKADPDLRVRTGGSYSPMYLSVGALHEAVAYVDRLYRYIVIRKNPPCPNPTCSCCAIETVTLRQPREIEEHDRVARVASPG